MEMTLKKNNKLTKVKVQNLTKFVKTISNNKISKIYFFIFV